MFLARFLLVASLVILCAAAHAETERIEVSSRYLEDGKRARVPVLIDAPENPGWILIDLPAGIGRGVLGVDKAGKASYGYATRPITRVRESLKAAGIAVVSVAAPADLEGAFTRRWREDPVYLKDTSAVVDDIRVRFPDKPIYIAGYAEAANSAIRYARKSDSRVAGYVLLGGYYGNMREETVEGIAKPVLMMHARTHKCAAASLIEARELAQRGRFRLVEAGYADWESNPDCGDGSQNALHGLDAQYAAALVQWLRDGTTPDAIGSADTPPAYYEEVHFLSAARLETSVFRPLGAGPFPLVVFNHGDVDIGSNAIRYGARHYDFQLAGLFVNMGFAVAFPQRPGLGRSAGRYQRAFSSADGDATYKGREHAIPILAAIEDLRKLPFVDRDRIVVAGQSAGGFSSMYVASTNPPWLVAAIDFSGGRTNMNTGAVANPMMVDAFAKYGSTTKIPTMWIFAENDSHYPKDVILTSHKAFLAAGGKAKLLLLPSVQGDGHFVYRAPKLWQDELRAYLVERGFAIGAGTVLAGKAVEARREMEQKRTE